LVRRPIPLSPRDRALLELIEEYRLLDTYQIYLLGLFPSLYTAQRRMGKLAAAKKVNRLRLDNSRFAYYPEKRPQQIDHIIGINDYRLWLNKNLPNGIQLQHWEYPDWTDKNDVRPDALYVTYNDWKKEKRFYFLEFETGTKMNTKIEDYNRFYASGRYRIHWWAKEATGFPTIVIVTEGSIKALEKRIATEKLEFMLYPAEKIRREIGK
jgi:hypothetical protein